MWPNLVEFIEYDCSIKNKLSYFNTSVNVHSLNLEVESDINFVKNKIREYVADSSKRTEGLLLLYAVVHCSSPLYVDNWGQIVLGALQCHDSIIPRKLPLTILNKILTDFGSESAYSEIFSKVIPDILPILLSQEGDKNYKLSCQSLAICIKYAPEIVGPHVAEIEKFLLKELDNPYGQVTEAIGECFAVLPLCMRYFLKTNVQPKDIWNNIFMKIFNTMKLLINDFLKLSKGQEEYFDLNALPVFDIPSSKLNNNMHVPQIEIFKSLCRCMAIMISSVDYVISPPIRELLVALEKIYRIVEIVESQSQEKKMEYIKLCFSQMVNGIHGILESLIIKFCIIDQSRNFVMFMKLSLNAIEKMSFSQSVSQVRSSVWKLINIWLKQYGTKGSCLLATDKNILSEIFRDIEIVEKENINSNQFQRSNGQEKNQNENKILGCVEALKVLKSLIETGNGYMEKHSLDDICSKLITTSNLVLSRNSKPFPYNNESCRKLLFDALLACLLYADQLASQYMMEAQGIFNMASSDTSTKVTRICNRLRKFIRFYLNPKKPPPDALQDMHGNFPNSAGPSSLEDVSADWGSRMEWNNANGSYGEDDDENGVAQVHEGSDRLECESDLIHMDHMEETDSHMNHDYRRIEKQTSQSMGDEESIDDSDVEPTYVSNDSNSHKIGLNNSHLNSFVMQSCSEQLSNHARTVRCVSEEAVPNVPNLSNTVENNIAEQVSAFEDIKSSAQKTSQIPMGNGDINESGEESDVDEGDEEGEGNDEASDNVADETSDGKHSPEFDEERPCKRQKCFDEEDDMDEEVDDEDVPVNNQSSDEEEAEESNACVLEQNAGNNSENLVDEESHDENGDIGCTSPSIRDMCNDFVLAEPPATQMS